MKKIRITITGEQGAGKTSIAESIYAMLALAPDEPAAMVSIEDGERKGACRNKRAQNEPASQDIAIVVMPEYSPGHRMRKPYELPSAEPYVVKSMTEEQKALVRSSISSGRAIIVAEPAPKPKERARRPSRARTLKHGFKWDRPMAGLYLATINGRSYRVRLEKARWIAVQDNTGSGTFLGSSSSLNVAKSICEHKAGIPKKSLSVEHAPELEGP